MWFGVVTLFPESFIGNRLIGITGRALREELISVECFNPREFATDRHRTVDDKPYGGGPGMLMKVAPLREAIHAAKSASTAPSGRSGPEVVPVPSGSAAHAGRPRAVGSDR